MPALRLALTLAALAALTGGVAMAQDQIGDLLKGQAPPPVAPTPAPTPTPTPVPEQPPPPPTQTPVAPPPEPEPKVEAPVKPAVKAGPRIPPGKRPRYPVAVLQAIDKVTAETMRFEAPVGQRVRYKNLVFTVRSCEATAADEIERDAIANIEIDFQPPSPAGRAPPAPKAVYRGWMFAASPSIAPLEHPVYDAWLIACKAS